MLSLERGRLPLFEVDFLIASAWSCLDSVITQPQPNTLRVTINHLRYVIRCPALDNIQLVKLFPIERFLFPLMQPLALEIAVIQPALEYASPDRYTTERTNSIDE